jgi:uncharacterized membrane protein YdjX (TVP38/TMEM64 family)
MSFMSRPLSSYLKALVPTTVLLFTMVFLGLVIQTYAFPRWLSEHSTGLVTLSPVLYILLVAGCMITGMTPSLPVVLLGGKIFHWGPAVLYTGIGALIGTMTAYFLARWGGRSLAVTLVGESKLQWFDRFFSKGLTFRTIVFLRLIPHPLYDAMNYLCGLANVPFRDYALATFLGGLPGCILIPLLGERLVKGGFTVLLILWLVAGVLIFTVFRARSK